MFRLRLLHRDQAMRKLRRPTKMGKNDASDLFPRHAMPQPERSVYVSKSVFAGEVEPDAR